MITIKSAEFVAGAANIDSAPQLNLPEIAVAGRSNVGKSTFLNRLARRKGLARTSSTPGRTQQLNFFSLKITTENQDTPIVLVDIPGWGFAKLSKEKKGNLSHLITDYLGQREELQLVCLLNDARRMPGFEELAMRDLAAKRDIALMVTLTKTDKLSRNELQKQKQLIAEQYTMLPEELFIAGEGIPMDDFWAAALEYRKRGFFQKI